jgi:hypothetical protein
MVTGTPAALSFVKASERVEGPPLYMKVKLPVFKSTPVETYVCVASHVLAMMY